MGEGLPWGDCEVSLLSVPRLGHPGRYSWELSLREAGTSCHLSSPHHVSGLGGTLLYRILGCFQSEL